MLYDAAMMRITSAVSGSLIIVICATAAAGEPRAFEGVGPSDSSLAAVNPIEQLQKDAEQGNVKAQYVLGCCFNGDHGCAQDPVKAAKWWGKAAANGHAEAQFCLGLSFFMGQGVPKDAAEAVKWWRKAADQDHMDAEYFLGLSYRTGLGVPKDTPLAISWLRKSANHGSGAALKLLREMGQSQS